MEQLSYIISTSNILISYLFKVMGNVYLKLYLIIYETTRECIKIIYWAKTQRPLINEADICKIEMNVG